jgi:hypothetical protein
MLKERWHGTARPQVPACRHMAGWRRTGKEAHLTPAWPRDETGRESWDELPRICVSVTGHFHNTQLRPATTQLNQ